MKRALRLRRNSLGARVTSRRRRTQGRGGRIVHGGNRADRPGFYLEPTIITDISEDNPLYQEEAFGPVLSFYVVESEEEAIQLANATRFGLGSYVFDADVEHARQVATRFEAGMVYINSCFADSPSLPFGGVKNSGFGRELSEPGNSDSPGPNAARERGWNAPSVAGPAVSVWTWRRAVG